MSNHYHVVLHVRTDIANHWSDLDVVNRWHRLFNGSLLSQAFIDGQTLSDTQWRILSKDIKRWRERLTDISWFMRVIKLLSCMAYVDLNPIRASLAKTPESSDYTSIKKRLIDLNQHQADSALEDFVGIHQNGIGIPLKLKDYLELVDWTGRIIRQDKRGHIGQSTPPILERLSLSSESWKILTTEFETHFTF